MATLVGTPRINLLEARQEDGTIAAAGAAACSSRRRRRCNSPASLLVGIRPEDVALSPDGQFGGEVTLTEPLGVETIIHIRTGSQIILSLFPGMTTLRVGDTVRFGLQQERLHLFGEDGRRVG